MEDVQAVIDSEVLVLDADFNSIETYLPEHEKMLTIIRDYTPELKRATSLFNKTQSQFMDNTFTLSHFTPLRNIRQALAQITKSKMALAEATIANERKRVEIEILEKEYDEEKDPLKQKLIMVDIKEKQYQIELTQGYMSGALRKIANYVEQIKSIKKEKKIGDFNELDFEKEDERYQIMRAFCQALTAARSRGGMIDEGNHIYFQKLGINGAVAQNCLSNYLIEEKKLFTKTSEPTNGLTLKFLYDMADIHQGSAERLAKFRGVKLMTDVALLKQGDMRLIKEK